MYYIKLSHGQRLNSTLMLEFVIHMQNKPSLINLFWVGNRGAINVYPPTENSVPSQQQL